MMMFVQRRRGVKGPLPLQRPMRQPAHFFLFLLTPPLLSSYFSLQHRQVLASLCESGLPRLDHTCWHSLRRHRDFLGRRSLDLIDVAVVEDAASVAVVVVVVGMIVDTWRKSTRNNVMGH